MILQGLYNFIQARSTRSGRKYGQVLVAPWDSPPSFSLSKLLESALAKEGHGVGEVERGDGGIEAVQVMEGVDEAPVDGAVGDCLEYKPGSSLEEGEIEDAPNVNGKRARKQRYRVSRKVKSFQSSRHLPAPAVLLKHIHASKEIPVDAHIPTLPFSSCSYQANGKAPLPLTAHRPQSLTLLLQQGFQLIKHIPGLSQPIVDTESQRVFAVVVGHPDDPTYIDAAQKVFEALEEVRRSLNLTTKGKQTDRGNFAYTNYGISHGQGSKAPHWLDCEHEDSIKELLANKHLIRLAKFANHSFAMWAPKAYLYYKDTLGKLAAKFSELKWGFWDSVWPCFTFNFGPQVNCIPHRDALNLPFGWCSITALGNYDYRLGGHLVLHDLRLVIEFPPGSLILIPSALLVHGNTPVQSGEHRMSFTQFCSGGIFRFVENGFICENALKVSDPTRYEERMAAKSGRREFGLGLWSTLEELLSSCAAL